MFKCCHFLDEEIILVFWRLETDPDMAGCNLSSWALSELIVHRIVLKKIKLIVHHIEKHQIAHTAVINQFKSLQCIHLSLNCCIATRKSFTWILAIEQLHCTNLKITAQKPICVFVICINAIFWIYGAVWWKVHKALNLLLLEGALQLLSWPWFWPFFCKWWNFLVVYKCFISVFKVFWIRTSDIDKLTEFNF